MFSHFPMNRSQGGRLLLAALSTLVLGTACGVEDGPESAELGSSNDPSHLSRTNCELILRGSKQDFSENVLVPDLALRRSQEDEPNCQPDALPTSPRERTFDALEE
jgi:hypothetical protein